MLYFTEEQNQNFTEDCLGGDEGSLVTQVSSQRVLSKILFCSEVKYKLNSTWPLGRATVQEAYNEPLWGELYVKGCWPLYSLNCHIQIVWPGIYKTSLYVYILPCASAKQSEVTLRWGSE